MKTYKGLRKRLKKSHPKNKRPQFTQQSKGRGSKHLKTKQGNTRKRRIRQKTKTRITKNIKRITASWK